MNDPFSALCDEDLLIALLSRLGINKDGVEARRLLERFGSFPDIFGAPASKLVSEGLTPRVASFISFLRPLFKQALLRDIKAFSSEASLVRFAVAAFLNQRAPCAAALFISDEPSYSVITLDRLGAGKVVSQACKRCADGVAVFGYVPSPIGLCPTVERLDIIKDISEALSTVGVRFLDYIAYRDFEFFGLRRAAFGGNVVSAEEAVETQYEKDRTFYNKLERYIAARESEEKIS